jgi:hypothetical protein
MKPLAVFTFWLISFCLAAQGRFVQKDDIPLPSADYVPCEVPVMISFREEIDSDYTDKSKIGPCFTGMAAHSRRQSFWSYPEGEDIGKAATQAFSFYNDLLKPRVHTEGGSGNAPEIDLTKLNNGDISEVVFYPSYFGGGVFIWYVFFNKELKRLSVTVGTGLNILEQIYAHNVPAIEPSEQETGFPRYPGAVFRPLESTYFSGDPCMVNLVYTSDDSVEKVNSYFDQVLGPKTHFMEMTTVNFRIRKTDNTEFHFWPTLKISHQLENHAIDGTVSPARTLIIYKYFIDGKIIKSRLQSSLPQYNEQCNAGL